MIKAQEIHVYEWPSGGAHIMYETEDGLRFTPEQWRMVQFMDRLEKKLDAALRKRRGK